jgi:hypothetical protein
MMVVLLAIVVLALGYEVWAVATKRPTFSRAIWRSGMRVFLAMSFGLLFGGLLSHWFWIPPECEALLSAPDGRP